MSNYRITVGPARYADDRKCSVCGQMRSIVIESGTCEECWKPTWVDVRCGYCAESVAVIEDHNKWRVDSDYIMCMPCFEERYVNDESDESAEGNAKPTKRVK